MLLSGNTTQRKSKLPTWVGICLGTCIALISINPAKSQEYDICIEALNASVFNPSTTPERACRRGLYCIANPVCCTPGCLAVPDCVIVRQVERTYDYIRHGDNLHCFQDDAARHLYENWRAGTISFALDSTTGGAFTPIVEFLKVDIETIYNGATSLPSPVQRLLEQLIEPIHDGGHTGYAYQDIVGTRITSEDTRIDTDLWRTQRAITLGKVIILGDNDFNSLVNAGEDISLRQVVEGQPTGNFARALRLLAHEMVHVKQYRVLGETEFLENYVLASFPIVTGGNEGGRFEREAYRFDAGITELHGGMFCSANQSNVNNNLNQFDVSRGPVVCDFTKMESVLSAVVM